MFQYNSLNTDTVKNFTEDLIHQLNLNLDMKASEVIEELERGKCFQYHSQKPFPRHEDFNVRTLFDGEDYSVSIVITDDYKSRIYKNIDRSILGDFESFLRGYQNWVILEEGESIFEVVNNLQEDFLTHLNYKLNESKNKDKNKKDVAQLAQLKENFWRSMGCQP